jgi:glycosyltransferase involved in cell wall biosynthesis/Flp pilus assembly protein TadD
MEVVSHSGLRTALEKLEQDLAEGAAVSAQRLSDLSASTVYWAKIAGQTQQLRRLATLLAGIGDMGAATTLLRDGLEAAPGDAQVALMYSDAIALENDFAGALQALSAASAQQPPHMRCAKKSVRLYQRLGRFDAAIALARTLADIDPTNIGLLISALAAADKQEEALLKAREVLATDPTELSVINACYRALSKLCAGDTETAAARDRLLSRADALGVGPLWRAQLLDRDGDLDAAGTEIIAGLAEKPGDVGLLKRSAEIALEQGCWGRDAGRLIQARSVAPAFSQLAEGIAAADSLLGSYGGSLDTAAREPAKFAYIKTPECVFDRAVKECPLPDHSMARSGLVMVAGSLGGYGAERILANTFRMFATRRSFEWTKFYISDFGKQTSEEFYQPLKDIPDSEVVVLGGPGKPDIPLAWIRGNQALPATRILERLKRDRPAVVHASLEPLNIFAGLAALLAGVPRIVLHTHNMRPTTLHIRNATRFKGCYQALLSRPEVVLAGCARACIDDYIDWLELKDTSKTHVVHNGYEFDEIAPRDDARRAALRAEYGIEPGAAVIGAAIRLTESKQPLLWVEAAAEILRRRPDCRFVMFGDGDQRLEVEERIRAKGLLRHFILPGRVTDLYDRLPLLDLYMLSSRTEGLPNALIEAQAAGVPVIALDVGGVKETMIPGITGLLIKELTAEALGAAALRALADLKWQRCAATLGADFVRQSFSLEKMIVTLSGILSESR